MHPSETGGGDSQKTGDEHADADIGSSADESDDPDYIYNGPLTRKRSLMRTSTRSYSASASRAGATSWQKHVSRGCTGPAASLNAPTPLITLFA